MKKFLILGLTALVATLTGCKKSKTDTTNFTLPQVQDVAMYQVNPRLFAPDHSLQAVTARIDSISDLGVNVVWVMPIYPIGKEKSKNSPYSISDYKRVNPEFGDIDDLRALVQACHKHGMALILDWVANHTAWDNVWLKKHPEWYTHDAKGNIVYPPQTDWTDVADLNYDNPQLRAAMIDAMSYWVREAGVDGFRCDVADMVPADFWHEAISTLRKQAAPRRLLFLAEGRDPKNFTVGGFDMNYAWDYMARTLDVFTAGMAADSLIACDREEYAALPQGKVKLRFTLNHDEATKYSPIDKFNGVRGSLAAWVATVMLHGGALIYGSQEVGYPKPINFFHYNRVNWMAHPEMYREYKRLLGLYNQYPALRKGTITPHAGKDVLMFEKSDQANRLLVAVNVRDSRQTIALPAGWAGQRVTDTRTGQPTQLGKQLQLGNYEYVILRLK